MFNLSAKKHYLVNSFTGFNNLYGTKIVSVYDNGTTLELDIRVNPTTDEYTTVEKVYTTVTYNLLNDTYTIKAEGKGSKKYNATIKKDVTSIINHLLSEATNKYNTDMSDSNSLTVDYYCTQLKEAGATTQQSNEMYYNINHTYNTIQEIEAAYKEIYTTLIQEVAVTVETTEEVTTYEVGNRAFTTYTEAYEYCTGSDFDPEEMIKEVATVQPSDTPNIQPEVVTYHYYNQTFSTYSEAYNYAISNMSPDTMILNSDHPTMNNERLMELEKQYTFSKHNMNYDDMKEYYSYIDTLPLSADKEERYYKLKSFIQRYENKQQSIKEREERLKHQSQQIDIMINNLYSIGMTKKEYEHGSTVYYYLNDTLIYSWTSGISTETMYNELLEVYNLHYKTPVTA